MVNKTFQMKIKKFPDRFNKFIHEKLWIKSRFGWNKSNGLQILDWGCGDTNSNQITNEQEAYSFNQNIKTKTGDLDRIIR